MLVSLNGILQKPGSSFTISGSTMTFASNLATGDVIDFVQILGNVLDIGAPSDDTVTAAKLNNDIISGQTALTSEPADTDEFLVSDAGTIKRIDYSLIKGSGKIAQVVSATKSDVTSSTSTSYADITGMTASITPSATSSKILVMYGINVSNTETDRNDFVRLMRDSTDLMDPAHYFRHQNNTVVFHISNTFLDSPSSTSSLSYHLEWKAESGTIYLNRRGADSTVRGASTITVMEVLA